MALIQFQRGNFKKRNQFASMYTDAEKQKIKPEIYTMGHRNAYTISVDTVKKSLSWGDVGPDEDGQRKSLIWLTSQDLSV
jgi:glucose/arabinose dehydrogenase